MIRRREFITLIGGAAAAWPLVARAQQPERMRRIGVLMGLREDDLETKSRLAKLRQELERLGWSEGSNLHMDIRFAPAGDQGSVLAKELVIGKWLSFLKEIAPSLVRVALMADPRSPVHDYFVRNAKAAAASLALELVSTPVENDGDIERSLDTFARQPDGGLLLPPDATTLTHRDLVIALAARHRLPAMYAFRVFVIAGGLMYYGTDQLDMFGRTASYIDRILRGARPADLPVQGPTKYETVLNLRTAKTLGLPVPPGLLVAADEVIE